MDFDFTEYFKRYEAIVAEVDAIFERVHQEYADRVQCGVGCSDCCYALFDISLIEALYLNHKFLETYDGAAKSVIFDRADKSDRENYRLKRRVFKASEEGVPAAQILEDIAKMRLRCPLLNKEDKCDLYAYRPVTCRLYGIPTAIEGQSHTCGKSGFEPGQPYPTVNIDKLQDKLIQLSQELVSTLATNHTQMGEILVPVSMALITTYDKDYLGIIDPENESVFGGPPTLDEAEAEGTGSSGSAWVIGGKDGENYRIDDICKSCTAEGCDPNSRDPKKCGMTPGGEKK